MKLKLFRTYTYVDCTEDESCWLWDYLSFENAAMRYIKRHVEVTDVKIRMWNPVKGTFPGGFTDLVVSAAREAGYEVEVDDTRVLPCVPDYKVDLSWLRDYQLDSVRRVVKRTRGLLWLPTAAGKTEIAIALSLALPCRWHFIVHRTQLAFQAADRYEERTGLKAGRIGDQQWSEERFTAATFQTLVAACKRGDQKALRFLHDAEGLIIDEAHTLPANTFWRTAVRADAYYRVGLSGTPLARGDRRSVLAIGALGPVIQRVRPQVLIDRGLLAKPQIRMLTVEQRSEAPTYSGIYGELVIRSARRNAALAKLAQAARKPAFLFVTSIKHGRALMQRLQGTGLRCEFVWGSKKVQQRQASVRRLERGDIDLIVCSAVFQEGIDCPALRAVIVGSSGRSVIAALQRLGRGMRIDREDPAEGGVFEVWDVADKGNRILERQAAERRRAYQREGYEVEMLGQDWLPPGEQPAPLVLT